MVIALQRHEDLVSHLESVALDLVDELAVAGQQHHVGCANAVADAAGLAAPDDWTNVAPFSARPVDE
jgi:hypothetical protein